MQKQSNLNTILSNNQNSLVSSVKDSININKLSLDINENNNNIEKVETLNNSMVKPQIEKSQKENEDNLYYDKIVRKNKYIYLSIIIYLYSLRKN